MITIFGAVDFEAAKSDPPHRVRGLPRPSRDWGGRGLSISGHGALLGVRARYPDEDPARHLWTDRVSNVSLVWSGRLDNLSDLQREFGGDLNEARLLCRAYLAWGLDLPDRLLGDFAFALWDARARRVVAARDAFGVSPLHFSWNGRSVVFASLPEDVLVLSGAPRDVDPVAVANFFSAQSMAPAHSFFREVRGLEPGHFLVADATRCASRRFFLPSPRRRISYRDEGEFHEHFRTAVMDAVRDRIRGTRAALVRVSGGLDSSAIYSLAEQLHAHDLLDGARVLAMSTVFTSGRASEAEFVDAVERCVGTPITRLDGDRLSILDISSPLVSRPAGREVAGVILQEVALAREVGARTIVCGFGGDQVAIEYGFLVDAFRLGRWVDLLRAFADVTKEEGRRRRRRFLPLLLGRSLLGDLGDPPAWLLRPCVATWEQHRRAGAGLPDTGLGTGRDVIWEALTGPGSGYFVDVAVRGLAEEGLTLMFPYLDRRVVDAVMSAGPWLRIPGRFHRRLPREAFSHDLPNTLLLRAEKAEGSDVLRGRALLAAEQLRALFSGQRWAAAKFLDQTELGKALDRGLSAPARLDGLGWLQLYWAGAFEAWMRTVLEYNPPLEELPVPSPDSATESRQVAEIRSERAAYVAPQVKPVGNVRDMVSGAGAGSNEPFPPGSKRV